jgi:hypothetical protein
LTFESVLKKITGELRLVIAKSFMDDEKLIGNDAEMEQNLININRERLLFEPQNGQMRVHLDYNPHKEKPCRIALIAASYIFVLSIIPTS